MRFHPAVDQQPTRTRLAMFMVVNRDTKLPMEGTRSSVRQEENRSGVIQHTPGLAVGVRHFTLGAKSYESVSQVLEHPTQPLPLPLGVLEIGYPGALPRETVPHHSPHHGRCGQRG
jgi:hypothetical protein